MTRTGDQASKQLGPRRRPGDPLGVRAGAGVARHRQVQAALRPVHRRQGRGGVGRRRRSRRRPVDRGAARRDRPGDRGRRRQGDPLGPPGHRQELGPAAGPRAGQVPVPDRPDPPGAEPRVRRPREHGLGQADQGEPRRRRPARGGPLLVLRRLGRQARLRVPRPDRPAARRGGPGHPVELPAAHAGLEDRPGAGRRQHGRPQAGQHDPADARCCSPTSAARPTCRPASSTSSPARARSGWPSSPTRASTRSRSPARRPSAS